MKIKGTFLAALVLMAASLATVPAVAAEYDIDPAHSSIEFQVKHLAISRTKGTFGEFSGTFAFEAGKPATWSCEATIKAASVDTGNEDRDNHLRSPDFFNVEEFPVLTFKSTGVEFDGDSEGTLRGELTIHGVTRVVELELEILGTASDPWGNDRAGFSAETKINRKDYGLTWNKALETGGLVVGEDVKIVLEVEGIKKK